MAPEHKYKEVTTLIQGPLNETGLSHIKTYSKYGPVVVSSWNDPDYDSLHRFMRQTPGVKFILTALPDIKKTTHCLQDSTFYWAICSMYHGLKNVETEYVVKTRMDEAFSELEPFIEPFLLDNKKMVCGNIFVQKFDRQQFHIGDHVFVAKTEVLLKATKQLKEIYENNAPAETWAQQGPYSAEQVLAFAFLNNNGISVPLVVNGSTSEDNRKVFCDNFHVVDVNEVGSFTLRWNHNECTYKDKFVNPHGVATMEDI